MILIIPALPEKVLVGANDDDIIEKRRVGFQNFVDRICRHPILSTSSVWKLFITETDEKACTFYVHSHLQNFNKIRIKLLS